ncbi:DinB family protein, partial [Mesorhizobium sp. M00.F.Ca.ET.186.01.1.1]
MNPAEIMHSMQQVTDLYIQELEAFDMDRLLQKPSEEEWSIGQMYQHLIQSALYMQLAN